MVASHRPFPSFGLFAVVVGLVALTRIASAAPPPGDPAAVAKVTNLNKKALDAYAKQDFEAAKDLLKQALDVCSSAGLDQHPITARTHIHFGVVAIAGFKQHEVGLKHFRKAIEIEPDIKLTKSLVTPELQDAFEEAVLAGNGPAGGEATPAAGGDENAGAGAGEAQGGEPAAGGDDDGAPKRAPKPKPRKKRGDDDDDKKDDEASGPGQKGSFFLGLTLGSGAGIASGSAHGDPAHKLASAGFAPGLLGQVKPEIGYFVTPTTLLSIAARLQYVTGLNGETRCGASGTAACTPLTTVGAVLLRATWLLTDGPFRFTFGGEIGGGYIAHTQTFPLVSTGKNPANCGADQMTQCVDALLGGPFLIGPTVGFFYELGDSVDLVVGLNSELGVPNFTFNFDLDAGIALRL